MRSLICPLQKIVLLIGEGEKRIMQIVRESGYAPQTVRKVVNTLVAQGLASERKDGKYAYVSLTERGRILYYCIDVIRRIEDGEKIERLKIFVGTA